MLWSSRMAQKWVAQVPLKVDIQGDLEIGACVGSLHKKQVDPRFPPQFHSADDFPSTN